VRRARRNTDKPCREREAAEPLPSPKPPKPPPHPSTSEPSIARAPLVAADDPTVITALHWGRLLDGELFASSSRLDWALLLKRSHGLDALVCPKCQATMRPIATLTDPQLVGAILVHLGLRAEPLPRAPARDPTGQESFDFDAA
jgi:hypothetical protein